MIQHFYTPEGAKIRYCQFGDDRPPVSELEKFVWAMDDDASTSYADERLIRVDNRLVLADMLIDFSLEDPQENDHLATARAVLEDVINDANNSRSLGRAEGWNFVATDAAQAYMRKAELDHWQQVRNKGTITPNYLGLLVAAKEADKLIRPLDTIKVTQVRYTVAELIPIILGVRAMVQAKQEKIGASAGWFGRTALRREDYRVGGLPLKTLNKVNFNWDVGITDHNQSSDSFVNPVIKCGIHAGDRRSKLSRRKRKGNEGGGVRFISAEDCEFDDTTLIIDSCLAEIDQHADTYIYQNLLRTHDLDRVTRLIGDRIFTSD